MYFNYVATIYYEPLVVKGLRFICYLNFLQRLTHTVVPCDSVSWKVTVADIDIQYLYFLSGAANNCRLVLRMRRKAPNQPFTPTHPYYKIKITIDNRQQWFPPVVSCIILKRVEQHFRIGSIIKVGHIDILGQCCNPTVGG